MAGSAMEDLTARYADRGVTSAFIYTREAHPAENYRHHTSMDGKRANAKAFVEQSNVRRRILLDDLEGTAHRAWGWLPNMTWIIGRGGVILYKSSWTFAEDVEDALVWALDHLARRRDDNLAYFYSERLAWRVNDPAAFKAGLDRNGPQAIADFFRK